MKQFLKSKLRESFNIPAFRLPKQVVISDEEKTKIKGIKWNDLVVDDLGGEGNIANLAIKFPFDTKANEGIVVDIQMIQGAIYQIHIHLAKELQGLGLGYKIYMAVIHDLGHLYTGKGRQLSPVVSKIWDKLKQSSELECMDSEIGSLCMIKNHPKKKILSKFMKS